MKSIKSICTLSRRSWGVLATILPLVVCLALLASCTAYRDFDDHERSSQISLERARELLADHVKIDRSVPAYYLAISREELAPMGVPEAYLPLIVQDLERLNRFVAKAKEQGAVVGLTTKHDFYSSEALDPQGEGTDALRALRYSEEVARSTVGRSGKVRFASPQPTAVVTIGTFVTGSDYWQLYIRSSSSRWAGSRQIALTGTCTIPRHSYRWVHDSSQKGLESYEWDFDVSIHAGLNSGAWIRIED